MRPVFRAAMAILEQSRFPICGLVVCANVVVPTFLSGEGAG